MSKPRRQRLSQKQEKRASDDVGGRLLPGSGGTRLSGGSDIRVPGYLRIECKYTEKPSYTLRLKDLEKLEKQAIKGGMEMPVFQIEYRDLKTGRTSTFAVTPSLSRDPNIVTTHKQARFKKRVLDDLLAENDKIILSFHEQKKFYEITTWDRFLEYLESLDES